jgi:hypothetical protein
VEADERTPDLSDLGGGRRGRGGRVLKSLSFPWLGAKSIFHNNEFLEDLSLIIFLL